MDRFQATYQTHYRCEGEGCENLIADHLIDDTADRILCPECQAADVPDERDECGEKLAACTCDDDERPIRVLIAE